MMKQDDSINIGMGGVGLWRRYVRLRSTIFAQRHGTINHFFSAPKKRLQQRNHDEQSASISVVLVGSSLLRFFLFASSSLASSWISSLAASLASSFTSTGPGNQ